MKSLFAFLLCFIFIFSNAQDSTALQFSKNITKASLEKHLKTLASDAYEGRGTGTHGQKKAAYYIKSHFEKLGLQPINPKDSAKYYQYFNFKSNPEETFPVHIKSLKKGHIFSILFYTNNDFIMDEEAIEVVWAGHGFDYSDTDIKDKIAVVWLGTPSDSIQKKHEINDTKSGILKSIYIKNKIAKENGAKAVFFIHKDKEEFEFFSTRVNSMAKFNNKIKLLESPQNTFGNVFFTPKALPQIFGISKKKFNSIFEKGIDFQLNALINIHTEYNLQRNITENVIGILPGTTKQDEFVIVCAHYDHLGKIGRNILNGADLGLLGSQTFTSNMVIPKKSIKSVVNIDMVGRGEFDEKNKFSIYIIGDSKSNKRNQKIADMSFPNVKLSYFYNSKNHVDRLYYRSDHYSFAKYDIPFIFFYTGIHRDYHRPSDESDKINYKTMRLVAQLIFLNIWEASR
ncbi:MAG: M28 family peptidase [Saprospiraceae bacterium]